jgi:serine/threonine protein kinase
VIVEPLRCGPFELTEVIGRGGFAEVWGGQHISRGVPVAVKIITAERVRASDRCSSVAFGSPG